MKEITAKVEAVKLINSNVYQVSLNVTDLSFYAGQYLMIILPTGEQVPYSIGSAPSELPSLDLYILVSDTNSLANKVIEHIKSAKNIIIKAPGGDSHIQNGVLEKKPEHILLIAGGTGFAQIKSLFDDLVVKQFSGNVSFYWGIRTAKDIFKQDWINNVKANSSFSLDVIVNEQNDQWDGRTGWLYEAILADHSDLSRSMAFISGSVAMVYGTLEQLESKGMLEENCFSDVFSYAPRPEKNVL